MEPSLSLPEPEKLTDSPSSAGEGEMESMVAVGRALMWRLAVAHSD